MVDEVLDREDAASRFVQLPDSLIEHVAIDKINRLVYIETNKVGNAHFLSWCARSRSQGAIFRIETRAFDEIVKLQGNGHREGGEQQIDFDMKVLPEAMRLITLAASYRASDLHFMMMGTHCVVQIEVNGGLRVLAQMAHGDGLTLARAIYQGLATVRDKEYKSLQSQNGQIAGEIFPKEYGIESTRIVRGPCYPQARGAEFMTLRILYEKVHAPRVQGLKPLPLPPRPEGQMTLLGYTASNLEKIERLMAMPTGVMIWSGPTGSGKTTSMFEVLQELCRRRPQDRLVTIEDPVEISMPWGVQMAVTNAATDEEAGVAFLGNLRTALRMAPKRILIGELRGPDVTAAAFEAATTGHQVFTTTHANDPFMIIDRIELMDSVRLARRVFCDEKLTRGLIAQRLLPRLCRSCSVKLTSENMEDLPHRMVRDLKTWGALTNVRLKGRGCERCNFEGTLDRFAVAEVVITDAQLMSDLIHHGNGVARANYYARADVDPPLLHQAIHYALNGVIDPRDVEAKVDLIVPHGAPRVALQRQEATNGR
jgi:type II secretory ATPase GspE/PulE/Tfp pilus assembly ATPase PilB-like protein